MNRDARHDPRRRAIRPRTLGTLVVLGLGATAGWLLTQPTRSARVEVMRTTPSLPHPARACREQSPSAARGAQAALSAAIARAERYAFAAREGIAALELFSEARACAELQRDEHALRAIAEGEASLRARMERDLHEHATRYRWARHADRLEDARDDIAFLLDVLGDGDDPSLAALRADRDAIDSRPKAKGAR